MACWYVASHLNLDSSLSSSPSPIPRLFSTLSDFTAFAPLPRWRRTAFDASTHLRARERPLFSKRFPSRRGGPNASYNLGREFEKYTCQRSRGFPLSNLNLLSGHDERHLRIVIKRNSIPSELYPENFTFLQFNSRRWPEERIILSLLGLSDGRTYRYLSPVSSFVQPRKQVSRTHSETTQTPRAKGVLNSRCFLGYFKVILSREGDEAAAQGQSELDIENQKQRRPVRASRQTSRQLDDADDCRPFREFIHLERKRKGERRRRDNNKRVTHRG